LAERQAGRKPLLDEPHDWMLARRHRLSGTSILGKALQYPLKRWEALARYLEDARLSIDNNLAERLLRRIALMRENSLFLGSAAGGDRAAIIYTVAETAKLNRLDPEACIATVLDRLARGHTTASTNSCHGTSSPTRHPWWSADACSSRAPAPAFPMFTRSR
jgi:hypothetical protein